MSKEKNPPEFCYLYIQKAVCMHLQRICFLLQEIADIGDLWFVIRRLIILNQKLQYSCKYRKI